MSEESEKHWHLDRRVPIALVGAIVVQTFSIGWWAAGISGRVANAETQTAAAQIRLTAIETRQLEADKLGVRVDERLKSLQDAVTRVENALVPPARPRP